MRRYIIFIIQYTVIILTNMHIYRHIYKYIFSYILIYIALIFLSYFLYLFFSAKFNILYYLVFTETIIYIVKYLPKRFIIVTLDVLIFPMFLERVKLPITHKTRSSCFSSSSRERERESSVPVPKLILQLS